MKSEHRHQLETNWLAKRLDVAIERFRPYASTIAGVVLALVVIMFLWSYIAGSSSARQSEAWDVFNLAVAEPMPDIEQLRQVAQEHPGTTMQQLADVTWADSEVLKASHNYIYNRSAAMEALAKATSAYQGVIHSSQDERLRNRAQLGLARVYELQGKLDEAREAYLKVAGGYGRYAKLQAERLAKPEAKEIYAWLENARPPLPRAPMGPGTPGQRPLFSEGELALPGGVVPPGSTAPDGSPAQGQSIDDLLRGLELDFGTPPPEGADRYAPDATPPATEATQEQAASDSADGTSQDGVTPPATETPATDSPTTDSPSTSPSTDNPPASDQQSN
jgi:predicted negative regulator of RcsB-dependent stress response